MTFKVDGQQRDHISARKTTFDDTMTFNMRRLAALILMCAVLVAVIYRQHIHPQASQPSSSIKQERHRRLQAIDTHPIAALQAQGIPPQQLDLSRSDYIFSRSCWDCAPIVLPSHKLVFFAVAKNGCTVFKQLFRRMMGHADWALQKFPAIPHDPKRNGLQYLYHFRLDEVREMLTSPEWTKAIFVRDPKERLLSAFLDKGLRSKGGHVRAKCCKGTWAGDEICKVERIASFEGFVNIIETCEDVHWAPQAERMEPKYWPYINFVGHLEHAAADTKALLQRIGAWDDYGASGWGSNQDEAIFESISLRNHATSANQKMRSYYTPKLEARVEKLYAMDYLHPVLNLPMKRIFDDI